MNIKIDKMKEELNNIAEKYSNDFNSQKKILGATKLQIVST